MITELYNMIETLNLISLTQWCLPLIPSIKMIHAKKNQQQQQTNKQTNKQTKKKQKEKQKPITSHECHLLKELRDILSCF